MARTSDAICLKCWASTEDSKCADQPGVPSARPSPLNGASQPLLPPLGLRDDRRLTVQEHSSDYRLSFQRFDGRMARRVYPGNG